MTQTQDYDHACIQLNHRQLLIADIIDSNFITNECPTISETTPGPGFQSTTAITTPPVTQRESAASASTGAALQPV